MHRTKDLDINLLDLSGEYTVILKIQNSDYIDIQEITNRANVEFKGLTTDSKNISIYTSNIRKRVMISVTDIGD